MKRSPQGRAVAQCLSQGQNAAQGGFASTQPGAHEAAASAGQCDSVTGKPSVQDPDRLYQDAHPTTSQQINRWFGVANTHHSSPARLRPATIAGPKALLISSYIRSRQSLHIAYICRDKLSEAVEVLPPIA